MEHVIPPGFDDYLILSVGSLNCSQGFQPAPACRSVPRALAQAEARREVLRDANSSINMEIKVWELRVLDGRHSARE